ncbi:uncharacterized protein PHACADRAFT_95219 [Phanerochaete carnosa HHB-10118-sp]|uniref:Uncharacterized protein n=1 Tax=Phanerochaete carnosa (strain HHB-10118-sp) TaxID=650164 RepID=K5W9N0_PHACS|nr:uncharacterized protein PHACADRAFT_95219 [Phanerochaete carnosa HHB-10118-sp]EKM55679.1 hypothetical protein PHACADRAFT_95219 [Phanerochaete carnosa HHB-10118-sp]
MTTESKSLFSLARNKLQSVVGGGAKDTSSLHRWVLLKNSIVRSHVHPDTPHPSDTDADPDYRQSDDCFEEEHDSFMFPDPHSVQDNQPTDAGNGERQWLDSLLEDLEDEGDDYLRTDDETAASHLPFSDEDTESLSPLSSPMSSSDDLVDHSSYFYPVPYPPVHSPHVPSWLSDSSASILPPTPPLYDNPLPYLNVDELDDSPVPDAIEDVSDDESDAPSTPSTVSTPTLSLPGSIIPVSRERTRLLSHPPPQVYVEMDDPYFCLFELDPLPFPDDTLAPSIHAYRGSYSEC